MNIRPSAAIRQNYNEIGLIQIPIRSRLPGPDAWKRGLFDRRGHFHDAQYDQGGRRTWCSKINTA